MAQDKTYSLTYHRLVPTDIKKLDAFWHGEVRDALEEKLTTQPELFGKPLRQSLKGCRALRVGDYRVVFRIQGSTVFILAILHRSVVYKEMGKR